MAKDRIMLCNGRYVINDPCYPFCSLPDGSGCNYFNTMNPFGKTKPYSVTYKDGFGGYVKKSYIPVIDPYQSITPKDLKFSGANGEESGKRGMFSDISPLMFIGGVVVTAVLLTAIFREMDFE
jgi:hypothetical protein